jgi:hypothetical protein
MFSCHFPDRDPANNRLDNLRWGTGKDNSADRKVQGTHMCGTQMGTAKLDDDKARAIFLSKKKHQELADENSVDRSLVGRIKARKAWRHATEGVGT